MNDSKNLYKKVDSLVSNIENIKLELDSSKLIICLRYLNKPINL